MTYNFLKVQNPLSIAEIKNATKREFLINPDIVSKVAEILEDVRTSGEEALFKYCKKYDGLNAVKIDDLKVSRQELTEAKNDVPEKYPKLLEAIKTAIKNLTEYHNAQFQMEPQTWYIEPESGKRLGQILNPLNRIGIYIPGGRYLYPSSILMAAVPAKIAGVKEIAVCTPPGPNGKIDQLLLYIFSLFGISEIYKAGGSQAIAALAFGTENIKRVDKIAGPGNIYVTTAKKLVYGSVGIDSLAGPSEIVIIADKSSKSSYIAADLLSQAEHDPNSVSILLTTDEAIANSTVKEIYRQIAFISENYKDRFDKLAVIETLKNHCKIFFNKDMRLLIEACNLLAPEHLEIMVDDFEKVLSSIKNAGAIFIGNYTPVAAGDYICGTNHVIPTAGNARFSSPLGVYDFFKKSSLAHYSSQSLKKEGKFIKILSDFENLIAHKNSIEVRFKK